MANNIRPMTVNVLITSVSKKVWLVQAFKNALKQAKLVGNIVSVDSDPLSAGLYVSDKHYLVPPSGDKAFITKIIDICRKENIKLIIPTRDEELLEFSERKEEFKEHGIEIMVSDKKIIDICRDKYKFFQFLKVNNIPTPNTILPKQVNDSNMVYPVIIKSRRGSGSKDLFKAKNEKELKFFINYIDDPIIQNYIDGKEYTVDLFSNFQKKTLSVVVRERIEAFHGESYKGKTVKDMDIIRGAKNVAEKLGTIGHITLQFIKNDSVIKLIEINPRFGGGAALGIKAGSNTPLFLLQLISGEKIEPQIGNFKEDLLMLRYTDDLFIIRNRVI